MGGTSEKNHPVNCALVDHADVADAPHAPHYCAISDQYQLSYDQYHIIYHISDQCDATMDGLRTHA